MGLSESEPLDLPEYDKRQCRQYHRTENNQCKGIRYLFQMDVHIHSVEAGYQRRNHQSYGKAGHTFHDGIHVVGDDGGEGIHRSGEDITLDIHRIKRLFQLNDNVFYQFLIQKVGVLKDTLQLTDHHFISPDGGVEVNQCFL